MAKQNEISLPNPIYAITPEGWHRISIVRENLGPQEELIRKVASASPVHIDRIGSSPNFVSPISMVVQNSEIVLYAYIPYIKIRTFFKVVKSESALVPTWIKKDDAIDMELSWPPLQRMGLLFVAIVSPESSAGFRSQHCYLAATSMKSKGFFRIPIPNIHEDARVCMGNAVSSGPSIIDTFSNAAENFQKSQWNMDLMHIHGEQTVAKYFSFNIKTQRPKVDEKSDWEKDFPKVSNAIFNRIILPS